LQRLPPETPNFSPVLQAARRGALSVNGPDPHRQNKTARTGGFVLPFCDLTAAASAEG